MGRKGLVAFFWILLLSGCGGLRPMPPTGVPIVPTLAPTSSLAVTPTQAGAVPTETPAMVVTGEATGTATTTVTPGPQGVDERIAFEPGAMSAVVENSVVGGTRDRYLLWARAGQEMTLELSSLEDNAALTLTAPDGRVLAGEGQGADVQEWEGSLPVTGDYAIVVAPIRGNATYRLAVTVPPFSVPNPTRVTFEVGSTFAQVGGQLRKGETDRYVLRAMEDQSMMVTLMAPPETANLGVAGQNGEVYLSPAEQQSGWWIPALPATQDYYISVTAISTTVEYVLEIGISALEDQPERIQFESGATSAAVQGNLEAGGDLDTYILQVNQGQTMVIEALPDGAPLNVYLRSEDGRYFFFAVENRLEVVIPWSGDYVISVSTPNAAGPQAYELQVSVE